MKNNWLPDIINKFLSSVSRVLGKIFQNAFIEGSIILGGFILATSNMVTFALFTIFMFLDIIDVYTGKFSHKKVILDRRAGGVTGFFGLTLLLWFFYFSSVDHGGGIGTLNFMAPFHYKVILFVFTECLLGILILLGWLLLNYVLVPLKKLWDYLNRWQQ